MDVLCNVKVLCLTPLLDRDKALEANGIKGPVSVPAVGEF